MELPWSQPCHSYPILGVALVGPALGCALAPGAVALGHAAEALVGALDLPRHQVRGCEGSGRGGGGLADQQADREGEREVGSGLGAGLFFFVFPPGWNWCCCCCCCRIADSERKGETVRGKDDKEKQ